jgi:hypothetical protein
VIKVQVLLGAISSSRICSLKSRNSSPSSRSASPIQLFSHEVVFIVSGKTSPSSDTLQNLSDVRIRLHHSGEKPLAATYTVGTKNGAFGFNVDTNGIFIAISPNCLDLSPMMDSLKS